MSQPKRMPCLTVGQAAARLTITEEEVLDLVDRGELSPRTRSPNQSRYQWRFALADVCRLAARLEDGQKKGAA